MQKRFWLIFSLLFLLTPALRGQEAAPVARGDSLMRAFRFQEALDLWRGIHTDGNPEQAATLERKMEQARCALTLADRCANPRVVARERFSREDFYLYYPLPDSAWHPSPNVFDPEEGYPLFLPEGEDVVYFSARDLSGARSLFVSEERGDSTWRAPRHPGEALLTRGSEVFPMRSPDGRTLYFASDGLPGMGGLDLFSSTWDEANATWGEPVNMGFPYNSPQDDFLLAETQDGAYLLFASNRNCSSDSVYVYTLEYEAFPLRSPLHDADALAQLEELLPTENYSTATRSAGNADMRLYMRRIKEEQSLRDSLYRRELDLDALRQRLTLAADSEAAALSERVREREKALEPLRKRISSVNAEIRRIEDNFLRRGVSRAEQGAPAEREQAGFSFRKRLPGKALTLPVGKPEGNYVLDIGPEGALAADNTLPEGIVYQIYLFTLPNHAREDSFGGLSPVYERLNSNLRYSYFAGLFPTYRLALQQLNVVRKLGFPNARIVAYSDGRSIPVNQARQEE